MTDRIALFGGTFDPIHLGHLLLAETCRAELGVDELWFLPAHIPPHKQTGTLTPGRQRAEMVELAVAGHPDFTVDPRELHRDAPSFTVETLTGLSAEQPETDWFFLIGGDSLADLMTWREPERIAELATIVAVNRGRTPPTTNHLPESIRSRLRLIEMPAIDLSSTEIRNRVERSESIRYRVPRAVEMYIADRELYREPTSQPI